MWEYKLTLGGANLLTEPLGFSNHVTPSGHFYTKTLTPAQTLSAGVTSLILIGPVRAAGELYYAGKAESIFSKGVADYAKMVEKIPVGITYNGTVFRSVNPNYIDSAWTIGAHNIEASYRYSSIGRGALYTSTSEAAMLAEMKHYGIDMATRSVINKEVSISNILDLTNPTVRDQLGIKLGQITSDDYFLTHALGDFARSRYNGILAPSAREAGTSNLILFDRGLP